MALVTAAAEKDGSGLRWVVRARLGGGKCKSGILANPPCLYRRCTAAEESSLPFFAKLSEFGLLAFLHSKNFKIKLIVLNNNKYITKNYC